MPDAADETGSAGAGPAGPVGARTGWELSTAVVLFHDAIAARLGVNVTDHKALGLLRRSGPMHSGALAAQLGVRPSAATGVVDRLESAGLAERVADPADRRSVLIRAVTMQASAEQESFRRLSEELTAFMLDLGESERQAVLDYIELSVRLLREETERLHQQP